MNKGKKTALKKAGYRITDARGFLELRDAEAALVEIKVALIERLREVRAKKGVSQIELAKRVGSSQSRIAKIEASAGDITLDLIFKVLFALGESPKDLGRTVARAS